MRIFLCTAVCRPQHKFFSILDNILYEKFNGNFYIQTNDFHIYIKKIGCSRQQNPSSPLTLPYPPPQTEAPLSWICINDSGLRCVEILIFGNHKVPQNWILSSANKTPSISRVGGFMQSSFLCVLCELFEDATARLSPAFCC